MITYSEKINVSIDQVWKHLVHKIKYPENFVPGVSNVYIKEETDYFVIREMDILQVDGHKFRLTEKITQGPYCVKFEILEHPIYEGYVDNTIEKISETQSEITFSLLWKHKESGEIFNNQELVKNAVIKTIKYIIESKTIETDIKIA